MDIIRAERPTMRVKRDNKATYLLRLPQDLLDWVREAAKVDARSVNGQIQYVLQQAKNKAEQEARS